VPIRFRLDEHVSFASAVTLRQREVDVTTAADAGLIAAEDTQHLAFAAAAGVFWSRRTRTFFGFTRNECLMPVSFTASNNREALGTCSGFRF
jgi:hypothetical protein